MNIVILFPVFLIILALLITACASRRQPSSSAPPQSPLLAIDARDGRSFRSSVIIRERNELQGVLAEHRWILNNFPPASQVTRQSLIYHDGKPYDMIQVKEANGRKRDVYFDISSFFGKL
jgi:hypothetical protein